MFIPPYSFTLSRSNKYSGRITKEAMRGVLFVDGSNYKVKRYAWPLSTDLSVIVIEGIKRWDGEPLSLKDVLLAMACITYFTPEPYFNLVELEEALLENGIPGLLTNEKPKPKPARKVGMLERLFGGGPVKGALALAKYKQHRASLVDAKKAEEPATVEAVVLEDKDDKDAIIARLMAENAALKARLTALESQVPVPSAPSQTVLGHAMVEADVPPVSVGAGGGAGGGAGAGAGADVVTASSTILPKQPAPVATNDGKLVVSAGDAAQAAELKLAKQLLYPPQHPVPTASTAAPSGTTEELGLTPVA